MVEPTKSAPVTTQLFSYLDFYSPTNFSIVQPPN